ncbi:hypothetical protein T265_01372 [Opisthorchis viverrini]|uniref:Uncharacterized protein n=1 Tax=Opisthorchis viverrini TaxID=6198 RepID=A0A075AJ36_OPIVI|nr:hypothetical protein T265_01372 [Opisthorchis viverrini]KER32699.1 hypothetical protein T265_01372 [Opisthorchis viverrini]
MASTSSKSRHPTYISSVLRNGDGSRRNSIFDIFAKQYTSQKSRLVTSQGKTKHPTTRVHSPENVDKRRGSLLITLAESTLLASCTVARQTSIDQKENSVNYSAAVIRQDAQIKPVVHSPENVDKRRGSLLITLAESTLLASCTVARQTSIDQKENSVNYSAAVIRQDAQIKPVVEQVNSKLQLNEGVLGVSNCLEALMKADGDDRLSVAILHDCGDTTSPLEDQESNHLDDLHTNTLISQSVQMNPVKIEADKKQFQTMWKRTESTLDKDTFTIVSLRVSSDSNSTLHSDTSSQVFPTEEDVQAQVV